MGRCWELFAETTRRAQAAMAMGMTMMMAMAMTAGAAAAQTEASFFSGLEHNNDQPIELAADSLEVLKARRVAIARGNVDLRQGLVRLTAEELQVGYAGDGETGDALAAGAIDRVVATGDVMISNGEVAVQANRAEYDVTAGDIVLTGDVLMVRDGGAIRSETLTIDLDAGVARMGGTGRVELQLEPSEER